MLYSVLDTGNFFVIPGSPVDVWAAERYSKTHSKIHLRKTNGFMEDDMLVVVVGSSLFYNELSWDYAVAMHAIGPLLTKYARKKEDEGSFKFVFLCGNSSDGYDDAFQVVGLIRCPLELCYCPISYHILSSRILSKCIQVPLFSLKKNFLDNGDRK